MPGLRVRSLALVLAAVALPAGVAGAAQAVGERGVASASPLVGQTVVSSVTYAAERREDVTIDDARDATRRTGDAATVPVVPVPVPTVELPAELPVEVEVPSVVATPRSLGVTSFYGDFSRHSHLENYRYVELNAWQAGLIPAIRAASPGVKVLMYKDMSSTRSYAVRNGVDDALLPTGVGYAASPAAWFLTDTTGARMEWPYDGHWWMDVASAEYQAAWAANVARDVAAGGWDGVVIDNVMADPQWYLGGRTIAKYPTRKAYAAATESFLAAVGPALTGTGATVIANISDASASTWDRWVGYVSGANHEHSFAWNNGQRYGGLDWLNRVGEIERTQAAGKIMTATSAAPAGDTSLLAWERASFLLAWDGGLSGSAQFFDLGASDAYSPVTSADLGVPVGVRTETAGGAWTRTYSAGTVMANPTTATVTVALAVPHRTLAGATVTSVTLAPLTGALLTR